MEEGGGIADGWIDYTERHIKQDEAAVSGVISFITT